MPANIYILSACDAWSGHNSMRILGVTTDESMLYAMIAAKIKEGDMEYDGRGEEAYRKFRQDFKDQEINLNKLRYGFVQTYEDMRITEPISLAEFPEAAVAYEEITGQRATAEIAKLQLDSRSLVYSLVEVQTDFGYRCFLAPGICDRDTLENSDQYQELMEDAEDTEVNISVLSYSVGSGESEKPDAEELKIIEQYMEELDEEYGVDALQSDFISFYYEAEQEH